FSTIKEKDFFMNTIENTTTQPQLIAVRPPRRAAASQGVPQGVRKELEAEGWGWIEISPERNYEFIHRCERLKPRLVGAPPELVEFKTRLDAELEQIEQALEDSESDDLLEQQQLTQERIDDAEEKLAASFGLQVSKKIFGHRI